MFLLRYFFNYEDDTQQNSCQNSQVQQPATKTETKNPLQDAYLELKGKRETAVELVNTLENDLQVVGKLLEKRHPKLETEDNKVKEHTFDLEKQNVQYLHEQRELQEYLADFTHLQEKYESAKKDNEDALKKNEEISKKISYLNSKIQNEKYLLKDLCISMKDLQIHYQKEYDQFQCLHMAKESLQTELAYLERKIEEEKVLREKYISLKIENSDLERENTKISVQIDQLKNESDASVPMIEHLNSMITAEKEQKRKKQILISEKLSNKSRQDQMITLGPKYEKLKSRNFELERENLEIIDKIKMLDKELAKRELESESKDSADLEEKNKNNNQQEQVDLGEPCFELPGTSLDSQNGQSGNYAAGKSPDQTESGEKSGSGKQNLQFPSIGQRVQLRGLLGMIYVDKGKCTLHKDDNMSDKTTHLKDNIFLHDNRIFVQHKYATEISLFEGTSV